MNYDDLANSIAGDIAMLGAALQGLYLSRLTPGRPVGPNDVLSFMAAARGVQTNIMGLIGTRFDAWRLALPALTNQTQLEEQQAVRTLAQMGGHMTAQLAERLRFGKSSEERLLSNMGGAFGQLVQQRYERVRLTATDAAGREWEASMLARVVARNFAVRSEFDARLSAYRNAGISTAYVTYRDSAHTDNSLAVNLSDDASLEEIRATFFHPNTSAKLEVHAVQA